MRSPPWEPSELWMHQVLGQMGLWDIVVLRNELLATWTWLCKNVLRLTLHLGRAICD